MFNSLKYVIIRYHLLKTMNERDFGLKVKARREELNLSQQDLAILMGLDQGKVSLIERGARKIDSVIELPMLAKALKCPLSWFYQDEELINSSDDPMQIIMNQYFPGIKFSEFEVRRMQHFLEPIIQNYAKADSVISQKVSEGESKKDVA